MKYLYLLLLSLIFISCQNNNKVEATTAKTKQYAFTDTAKTDTFKVDLIGEKSDDMSIVFTITDFNGIEIYKEEVKATQLLKSYLASEDLTKESDKIKFLNEQVDVFFDEEHFLEPAVTEDQQADNNTPDKAFYEELKQNQLNGFYYSLGKDKSIYIAWSPTEKKVKVYYKCC
jgi:hypothetical protein